MPRRPRLDAQGVAYQVITRGVQGCGIFGDDVDRQRFVGRSARLVGADAVGLCA